MTHNTTANPFYVFNTEKSLGKASYFANSLAIENGEVGGFVKGNTNISTFLNIRNPYESIEFTDFDDAREEGYDGAIISGDGMMVAAAFSPNQIKSATDNIGTFSKEDNNIYDRVQQNETREVQETKPIGTIRDRRKKKPSTTKPKVERTIPNKFKWGVFEGANISVNEITEALNAQGITTEEQWNNRTDEEMERVLHCCGAI